MLKWSQPISLQSFLIIIISGRNQSISQIFSMDIYRICNCYFWSGVASSCTSCLIRLEHQYLWKESIDVCFSPWSQVFCKEFFWKVASDTTLSSLWPGVPFVQLDCKVLLSSISRKRVNRFFTFLYGDSHQRKVGSGQDIVFGWVLQDVSFIQSDCRIQSELQTFRLEIGKVVCQTNIFGWMRPGVSLIQPESIDTFV